MDVIAGKLAADKLSLDDLHEFSRDQLAELVSAGLLPADLAAEIQSEDIQKKDDQQQLDVSQHMQAQRQHEEQKSDAEWLEKMNQSYQQAYHQLMDTYDDAENEYGTIESHADELKDSFRQKMETARQYGISLPDGEQAFLDTKHNAFVDGSLQRLNETDSKEAAVEFKLMTPQQQNANACYVSACEAYSDAADISRQADARKLEVENAKTTLENSDGTISEAALRQADKDAQKQVDGLSSRLNKLQDTDANLDAALSADGNEPSTPVGNSSNGISFASTVAANGNAVGDENGRTATAFNAVANSAPQGDAPAPDSRAVPVVHAPSAPSP